MTDSGTCRHFNGVRDIDYCALVNKAVDCGGESINCPYYKEADEAAQDSETDARIAQYEDERR